MLLQYIIAMIVAVIAIVLAIILGEHGPWYLSWFLGTGFMVLVAAAGGILFEAQEEARAAKANGAGDAGKAPAGGQARRK